MFLRYTKTLMHNVLPKCVLFLYFFKKKIGISQMYIVQVGLKKISNFDT